MEQVETLLRLSDSLEKHTIAVRRMIHQKPELAFEEYKTAGLVMQELRRMGIPYEESPVEPGIVAVIDSGKPGKLLMLRADMDALPIEETAQVSFRSLNKGVMHACGHDVHTANLLAVGEILNGMKEFWSGRVTGARKRCPRQRTLRCSGMEKYCCLTMKTGIHCFIMRQ